MGTEATPAGEPTPAPKRIMLSRIGTLRFLRDACRQIAKEARANGNDKGADMALLNAARVEEKLNAELLRQKEAYEAAGQKPPPVVIGMKAAVVTSRAPGRKLAVIAGSGTINAESCEEA